MKENKSENQNDEDIFIEDDSDKRVITFIIIATLAIIGIIIFLLLDCKKREELKEPVEDLILPTETDIKEDIIEDTTKDIYEIEEVVVKKTSLIKTATKEKKTFKVKFYFNNQYPVVKSIKEGEKVSAYKPDGFKSCNYSLNDSSIFDFNSTITNDLEIYMNCDPEKYIIVYDTNTSNPTTYSILDGNIELIKENVDNDIFVGWYSDSIFTNKVSTLTYDTVKSLADANNVVYLYSKVVDSFDYKIYNSDGTIATELLIVDDIKFNLPSSNNSYCLAGEKHLGWSTIFESQIIEYSLNEEIMIDSDLNIYAVCGSTEIIYKSSDEVQAKEAIEEEKLNDYVLPTDEDLNLEKPIYYFPVNNETDISMEIIDNYTTPDEKQIKLEEVEKSIAAGYIPIVGDLVEEHEKEFGGWTTEDTDSSSSTYGKQVPVSNDYLPPANSEVELNANWIEIITYNPSTGA